MSRPHRKKEKPLTCAEAGRVGGLTRGDAKRRGDAAYYKALAAKAHAKRYGTKPAQ